MDKCSNCGCDKSLTNDKHCPICGVAGESALNDLLCAIQNLAQLLEVEDHELLECIEGRMISAANTKPLWLILNT